MRSALPMFSKNNIWRVFYLAIVHVSLELIDKYFTHSCEDGIAAGFMKKCCRIMHAPLRRVLNTAVYLPRGVNHGIAPNGIVPMELNPRNY